MNKISFYLTLISLFVSISACNYDRVEGKCTKDKSDYNYILPPYSYGLPSINPNNANELLFLRAGKGKTSICVFNLQSRELNIVSSPNTSFDSRDLAWGNDNWIYFTAKDLQIWKIKSNGDSLTQVTSRNGNFYPRVNTLKRKMMCESVCFGCYEPDPIRSGKVDLRSILIFDEKSNLLDSILCTTCTRGFTWQNAENIAYFGHLDAKNPIGTVVVLNPDTKEVIRLSTYNYDGNTETGMCWIDSNTLFYSIESGLFKIDIANKKTTQLRITCNKEKYWYPSYSPALDRLVVVRQKQISKRKDVIELEFKICFMDTEGKELETIDIPE
jgi:hypothetical protein